MIRSSLAALGAAVIAAGAGVMESTSAQSPASPAERPANTALAKPATYSAPRTPWGDPDLQGVWSSDDEAGVPLERPSGQDKPSVEGSELEDLLERRAHQRASTAGTIGGATGAGPTHWYENWGRASARTSLIVDPPDGHVPPLTPDAQKRQRTRAGGGGSFGSGPFDTPADFTLYDRCITRGLPAVMFPAIYNNNTRIVQAPGYVALTYEMIHETRVIPLDERPFTSERIRGYLGDARARWEGDTLVVETQNFSSRTNYRGAGATLRLVERLRRVRHKKLRYEVTVIDPHTFTRPWTAVVNLGPGVDLFEYACHEGNYAMRHMLSAARAAETDAKSMKR
jgi:hypothetical protein